MMKMMLRRRGVAIAMKLSVGFRSFKSTSYSPTDISNKYKFSMKYDNPPLLVNFGQGYFQMLHSNLVRHGSDKPPLVSFQFPYNFVVSGPCGGLFCLYSVNGNVALWNPGTGDIKNLSAQEEVPVDQEIEIQNLGFGFDSNANDYKMVRSIARRFVNPYDKSVDHIIHQTEIYTLKTKQWREIPVSGQIRSLLPYILSPASFADGACYWTVPSEDDEVNKNVLISFDFTEEEFHLHSLPPSANGFGSFQVFNLNGWPAAFGCTWHDESHVLIDVWTRTPVNGVKTWIHPMEVSPICKLPYCHCDDAHDISDDAHVFRPLCLWNNQCLWQNQGLVLMDDYDKKVLYCDFRTNECRHPSYYPLGWSEPNTMETIENPPVQVLTFPESFVANPW